MTEKGELLVKNIKEFYSEGEHALGRKAYNSAASLFFKALAVLTDWYLLKKEGFIPKSHTDRFRLLQQKYPDIYNILDKDFPVYQESYDLILTREAAEELKNDIRMLAKKVEFKMD